MIFCDDGDGDGRCWFKPMHFKKYLAEHGDSDYEACDICHCNPCICGGGGCNVCKHDRCVCVRLNVSSSADNGDDEDAKMDELGDNGFVIDDCLVINDGVVDFDVGMENNDNGPVDNNGNESGSGNGNLDNVSVDGGDDVMIMATTLLFLMMSLNTMTLMSMRVKMMCCRM